MPREGWHIPLIHPDPTATTTPTAATAAAATAAAAAEVGTEAAAEVLAAEAHREMCELLLLRLLPTSELEQLAASLPGQPEP